MWQLGVIQIQIETPRHLLAAHEAGLLLLAGFLVSWVFIRTSARLMRSPKVSWWPGSVTKGDVHIHHLVWGIVTLLVSGFFIAALAPRAPWLEILAVLFGIGAGLTLDEFALWLRLEDVYWSEEGRASVDAVIVAVAIAAMVVFALPSVRVSGHWIVDFLPLVIASCCVICLLKGKIKLGLFGLIGVTFPFVVVGAIRLASPGSPWARWFYKDDPSKCARAQDRFERVKTRRQRVFDVIAGSPSEPGERLGS